MISKAQAIEMVAGIASDIAAIVTALLPSLLFASLACFSGQQIAKLRPAVSAVGGIHD